MQMAKLPQQATGNDTAERSTSVVGRKKRGELIDQKKILVRCSGVHGEGGWGTPCRADEVLYFRKGAWRRTFRVEDGIPDTQKLY